VTTNDSPLLGPSSDEASRPGRHDRTDQAMTTCTQPHHPAYIFCSDPETCCGHWWPVAITCAVDGQRWPCEIKRSHHTETQVARLMRWVDSRLGRP
jgi:hypothetical protein